jgi:5-methylcytosine-specific restriction protein B
LGLANLRPVLDDKTFAQRLDLLQEVVEVQGRVALSTYAYTPKAERPLVREEVEQPAYSAEAFAQETGFAPAQLHQWEERLRRQRQLILYGPPGTGKTYLAERLARRLTGGTRGFWELVQFHPSYAYEDFVQGIRPVVRQGVLTYELVEGRFLAFCHRARDRENAPCALVIDEINRAHLARVFGELMYLLEYRDRAVPLAAGGEPFALPGNVHLIGTMNTADRSIALVDQALRRRFAFIRLRPEYGVLARCLERHGQPSTGLVEVLRDINRQIGDANYELGISFFMRDGQHLRRVLPQIWKGEVEPYLEEVFYDRPEQVEEWRWEALAEDRLKEWTE